VPHQIVLRGFAGTPVGSDRGKFLDDERLDVRNGGFLIIGVGPDVSNVWISQADNLARVTRIGENFLISGEAGIENDFAAAPGDRSRCAALKYSPVFERENSRTISPSIYGWVDSWSSGFAPIFPICGYVRQTIWPA
jgi:hypothetical protein